MQRHWRKRGRSIPKAGANVEPIIPVLRFNEDVAVQEKFHQAACLLR